MIETERYVECEFTASSTGAGPRFKPHHNQSVDTLKWFIRLFLTLIEQIRDNKSVFKYPKNCISFNKIKKKWSMNNLQGPMKIEFIFSFLAVVHRTWINDGDRDFVVTPWTLRAAHSNFVSMKYIFIYFITEHWAYGRLNKKSLEILFEKYVWISDFYVHTNVHSKFQFNDNERLSQIRVQWNRPTTFKHKITQSFFHLLLKTVTGTDDQFSHENTFFSVLST